MKFTKKIFLPILETGLLILLIVFLGYLISPLLGNIATKLNQQVSSVVPSVQPYPPPQDHLSTATSTDRLYPLSENATQTLKPPNPTQVNTNIPVPTGTPDYPEDPTNTFIPLPTLAGDTEGEILFFAVDQAEVKQKKIKVDREGKAIEELPEIPLDFISPSEFGNVYPSSDGKYLVVLRLTEGPAGFVLDIATGERFEPLTSFSFEVFFGWFPDSKHILVSDDQGLWMVDPITRGKAIPLEVDDSRLGSITGAAASPDGKEIIFSYLPPNSYDAELWKVCAQGRDARKLFDLQDNAGLFAWSPDGEKIAFWSAGGYWVMDADGTNLRFLGEMQFGFNRLPPLWSPDSRTLLVDLGGTPVAGGSVFDGSNIFLIDVETGDKRTLFLDGSTGNLEPNWSPDGTMITFVSDRSGKPDIWVINKDGSDPRKITGLEKYLRFPFWSKSSPPDGWPADHQ